jgi:hypothetical protein
VAAFATKMDRTQNGNLISPKIVASPVSESLKLAQERGPAVTTVHAKPIDAREFGSDSVRESGPSICCYERK